MIEYEIRRAVAADAEAIARHRVRMFIDMGDIDDSAVPGLESATLVRLKVELVSGEYLGWVAEAHGGVVAGAGVILHSHYPNVKNPLGRPVAHIVNVYTDPPHRRRGLATRLLAAILQWARAEDLRFATLHASSAGRPVYECLGFVPTNEMRVDLKTG